LLCTVFDRDGFSVHAVDDFLAILMKLAPLPELQQSSLWAPVSASLPMQANLKYLRGNMLAFVYY